MIKIRKENIKESISILLKGIYAGIMIGIGGTIYLSVSNQVVGAILFAIGLLTICVYKMNLYTGMIGYILENKLGYLKTLIFTLLGNLLGTIITALLILNTRIANISIRARETAIIKISDNYLSIFILSVFCGILMYIAVNNFKKGEDSIIKYLSIFICVVVFILCGFEHCIANMYYFSVADIWSLKTLGYTGIMVLGNSIGSFIIPLCNLVIKEN